jgi:hypothetical protein
MEKLPSWLPGNFCSVSWRRALTDWLADKKIPPILSKVEGTGQSSISE